MYATLQTWELIIYSGKHIKSFEPNFTGGTKNPANDSNRYSKRKYQCDLIYLTVEIFYSFRVQISCGLFFNTYESVNMQYLEITEFQNNRYVII